MGIETFLEKIKKHWFAFVLLIALLWVVGNFFGAGSMIGGISSRSESMAYAPQMDMAYGGGYDKSYYGGSQDFAPEEEERKIEKSASLTTEVDRGEFDESEQRLKGIISSADGIILNQNVRKWSGSSRTGSYSLKVPTDQYDSVVADLQEIGDVDNFNENTRDITGSYLNLEQELETERARLDRYEALYKQEGDLEARLNLEDRIFDQERRIEYLEGRMTNMDQRIEYSSVQVTIREEPSGYERIGFVKFSDLVKSFVSSTTGLLYTIAYVLPWTLFLGIIWFIVRFFKRRTE